MLNSIKIEWTVLILAVTGCLFTSQVNAQAANRFYGKWIVGTQNNNLGLYASTVNDSGLVLGEYCYSDGGKCLWIVGADTACDKDSSYPTLGNTNEGAAPLVLTCIGKVEGTNNYAYVFTDWKELEGLLKKSTILGLAVPMQGDQFRVWRFSLDGMVAALADMEGAFSRQPPTNTNTPTGTSTINL